MVARTELEPVSTTPLQRARGLRYSLETLMMPVLVADWYASTQEPDYEENGAPDSQGSFDLLVYAGGEWSTSKSRLQIAVKRTVLNLVVSVHMHDLPGHVLPLFDQVVGEEGCLFTKLILSVGGQPAAAYVERRRRELAGTCQRDVSKNRVNWELISAQRVWR